MIFIIVIVVNYGAKIHLLSHISKLLGQTAVICDEWQAEYPIFVAFCPTLLHNPINSHTFAAENFIMKTDMTMLKLCLAAIVAMTGVESAMAQTEKKDTVDYSLNLKELEVKSTAARTKMRNGAMVTRIVGSPLESAGSVEDMLSRVPGMMRMGGQLQVIGKGSPIYYINGRKVQDMEELKRLRSRDIREVEVINSPGAAFDASVNAVVRIKTRRQQGEGLSGRLDVSDDQALKSGNNNLASTLNLNYRHEGLDFFGGATFQNDYLDGYRTILEQTTYGTGVTHRQTGDTQADEKFSRIHYNAGVNWQIDDDNFVGVKMERGKWLKNNFVFTMEEDILRNGVKEDYLKSVSDFDYKNPNTLQANAYYNGKIGKWGIDANVDYYSQCDKNDDNINEQALSGTRMVESMTENKSRLFAARLVADYPLWNGKLTLGGELTTVCRDNNYRISGVENISDRLSEVSEQNYAAFFEYGIMIPKAGMLTLGMRYEHVAFYSYFVSPTGFRWRALFGDTNYPAGYEIHGIDISHYQGTIDWDKLRDSNIEGYPLRFVMIKSTEGSSRTDNKFKENFRQAREHGLIRGAYHFWSNKSSARDQAYFFLKQVRLENGDLPPVLDVEHKPQDRNVEDFQRDILTWLHIVEDKYHVKPIIYTYYKFKENYLDAPVFDDYPYWIAHYYVDKVEYKGTWHFWQHTDAGKLPGIKGYVDFNIFNGSFYALKKLTIGNQD